MTRPSWQNELQGLFEDLFRHVESWADGPVFGALDSHHNLDLTICEAGQPSAEWLEQGLQTIFGRGLNGLTGRHMAYIPGSALPMAAWANFVTSLLNPYSAMAGVSPGAVDVENECLQWMANWIGYPLDFAGNFTSGGSSAHLLAIHTAREAQPPHEMGSTIYLTDQAHHSFAKALRVAGLSHLTVRLVPTNAKYQMDTEKLSQLLQRDKSEGLHPWLIMASAGTTNSGAVDDLNQIAELSQTYKTWFHVDAAYGGPFMLVPECRHVLSGLQHSDSVIIDPHKGLFMPFGLGAVLVRNRKQMLDAFDFDAAYIQDAVAKDTYSPADTSVELTRPFRAFPLWVCLKMYGTQFFRDHLQRKRNYALRIYNLLADDPEFEVGPKPELSVVLFRFKFKDPSLMDGNAALARAMRKHGQYFLSGTEIEGTFWNRFAILTFRTEWSDIEGAYQALKRLAKEL